MEKRGLEPLRSWTTSLHARTDTYTHTTRKTTTKALTTRYLERYQEKKEKRGGSSLVCRVRFIQWLLQRLLRQRDFDGADVCWSASLFTLTRWQLLRAYVNSLHFDLWQESASHDFDDVDCMAYCHSSCFDFHFTSSAVEEGYAGQNVVHRRLSSNQHRIAITWL